MKYDQEVYEALAENERIALTEEVLRIGDALGLKTTSSDYNAFKVMEVIKQLIDASRLASKPMKKRPLTDDAILLNARYCEELYTTYDKETDTNTVHVRFDALRFARAIERAHGIGE